MKVGNQSVDVCVSRKVKKRDGDETNEQETRGWIVCVCVFVNVFVRGKKDKKKQETNKMSNPHTLKARPFLSLFGAAAFLSPALPSTSSLRRSFFPSLLHIHT